MKTYSSEAKLRKDVAKALEFPLRIEPSTGSTFGLPDFIVVREGVLIPLECKLPDGTFTRNQKILFPKLIRSGIPILVIYPPTHKGEVFSLHRLYLLRGEFKTIVASVPKDGLEATIDRLCSEANNDLLADFKSSVLVDE